MHSLCESLLVALGSKSVSFSEVNLLDRPGCIFLANLLQTFPVGAMVIVTY